ncbi:MAG TPA: hypothetical protein VFF30_03575 [Nitrososphaerales archaeon]|nr:hypothetical protein [Nitrososphaerales archaeon]
MKASQLLYGGSKDGAEQAIALLEQAVLRDPSFVRAHVALAYGWWQIGNNGYEDFDFAVTKAEDAALKALQLGPDIAESHAAIANVYSLTDRFEDSIVEAEKAIQINPNLLRCMKLLQPSALPSDSCTRRLTRLLGRTSSIPCRCARLPACLCVTS